MYGREPSFPMNINGDLQCSDLQPDMLQRLLIITDQIPQLREDARRQIEKHQSEIAKKFQSKTRSFKIGELVLYKDMVGAGRHDTKLEDKWKGPYQITAVLNKGAYKIALDGKELRSTVNRNLLKPFYGRSTWEPVIRL